MRGTLCISVCVGEPCSPCWRALLHLSYTSVGRKWVGKENRTQQGRGLGTGSCEWRPQHALPEAGAGSLGWAGRAGRKAPEGAEEVGRPRGLPRPGRVGMASV